MKTYLGTLIGLTAVLFVAGMQATPLMGADSDSDSGQVENSTEHASTGKWQTIDTGDGGGCEGLVFESAEGAEEAALTIGCTGYHEHHQEGGTVVYMPCDVRPEDATLKVEAIEAEIRDALVRGEITQEQADEKLAWLEAKNQQ